MNTVEISDAYLNYICYLERLHQFIFSCPVASDHVFLLHSSLESQKIAPCAFC